MAFDYAKAYQQFIDEEMTALSATAWMVPEAGKVRFTGGRDVEISTLSTSGLGSYDATKSDGSAYLSRFGVSPEFQNHGVGKSLMSVVDTVMMEKGVSRLELHTAAKYFDLVRFYYGRKFYIDSISEDRGYKRALMVKEYKKI